MKCTILASMAWVLVAGLAGCDSGAGGDGNRGAVSAVALSDTQAPGLAFNLAGGHVDGHGDPWGGRDDSGCHDAGPGRDAVVGDEGNGGDPGVGPGSGTCGGVFEMQVRKGPPDDGTPLSSWRRGPFTTSNEPLLHLIGLREPSDVPAGAEMPNGDLVVHVGPTERPLVLAISSERPVALILELDPGAEVEGVVLLGFQPGAVTVLDGDWRFWITDLTNGETEAFGYCWPSCEGGGDLPAVIRQVESATGLQVEAFDGAYHLEALTIRHVCTDCTPACDGRECGLDGCGGTCGACGTGDACGADGRCEGPDEDVATGTCPGPFALRFFEGLADDIYPYTFYRAGPLASSDEPLLHLVGIYESRTQHFWEGMTHPAGRAILHVGPTQRPEVLALSAYDATDWVLDLDPLAQVRSVVLTGYYPQTVTAPEAIPVQNLSGGETDSSGYCWPFCDGGSDTRRLVEQVESATGLTLGAFDGVYHLEEAWIHHTCTGCVADCTGRVCGDDGCGGSCGNCDKGLACADDGRCLATQAAPPCIGLPGGQHYCLALTATGAALVGLESGEFCSLGPQTGILSAVGLGATSIAWEGDHVYACNSAAGYNGLMRFSLIDGTWDIAPVAGCLGVASWNGGLAVLINDWGFRIRAFASFEDAVAGRALPLGIQVHASRFAVRGDTAYTAWHSTGEILSVGLGDGVAGNPIPLEGFDTWVEGLSVTDDDLLVVNSWWPERRLAVFDANTGHALWNVTNLPVASDEFTGLVCRTK